MKTKILLTIGIILLFGSVGLFTLRDRAASEVAQPAVRPQVVHAVQPPAASGASTPAPQGPQVIEGSPVKLDIPSLSLSVSVIPGVYDAQTQKWTLTRDKAQYATMTPLPNNTGGNTFIYGHNRREVFAKLPAIPAGAEAVLTTANGHVFYYKLASIRTTNPEDDSVFNNQASPVLTIQTCTGLFYQNRELFTFNFERVV